MRLESLPPIILAIAEHRSLGAVLKTIIETVARQPDVAFARLWLLEPNGACPVCAPGDLSSEPCLHLRASAGTPLSSGSDWSRLNGAFHRVPLSPGDLKIAHIAATGESIRISNLSADRQWIRYPAWANAEGLVSFAGHALVFRGDVLGVLAVFPAHGSRRRLLCLAAYHGERRGRGDCQRPVL